MKNKNILRVADKYRDWLATMNFLSFDQLMFSDLGSIVEKFKTQEIRRIEGHGTVAYLKRRLTSPISKSLEMYLEGQRAHSAPFNEYLHICELQRHQLPVMKAMATGEQRRLGFPGCGFVLVEEVKGIQMDRLLCQCKDPGKTKELLQSYGQLIARVHQAGFYCPLRLKDIIVTDDGESLVMIDRETRHPYPHYRSKYRAHRSLRIAFRRTVREYPSFDETQMSIIMQSYNKSTSRHD
jgi:hypothetical protein